MCLLLAIRLGVDDDNDDDGDDYYYYGVKLCCQPLF